jgi:hypothetical protein
MDDFVLKIVTTLGVPGLSIYLLYRLMDRYAAKLVEHAGRFVDASIRQSAATTELVAAVRLASTDQRDVLLAVRSMSTELAALKGWVKEAEGMHTK